MSGHIASSFLACGSSSRLTRGGQLQRPLLPRARVRACRPAASRRWRAAAGPRAPAGPVAARAACSRAPCRRCRPDSVTAPPGTIGTWCVLWRVVTHVGSCGWRSLASPSACSRGSSAWYSAVTPSSLKRLAMVPNTGICSGGVLEGLAVALHLLGDVAQRVGGALAVELVDGDELGEVEHVDLLKLAGGAELGRHHVQRHVDQRHDRRVALADAARSRRR